MSIASDEAALPGSPTKSSINTHSRTSGSVLLAPLGEIFPALSVDQPAEQHDTDEVGYDDAEWRWPRLPQRICNALGVVAIALGVLTITIQVSASMLGTRLSSLLMCFPVGFLFLSSGLLVMSAGNTKQTPKMLQSIIVSSMTITCSIAVIVVYSCGAHLDARDGKQAAFVATNVLLAQMGIFQLIVSCFIVGIISKTMVLTHEKPPVVHNHGEAPQTFLPPLHTLDMF
ncbi:hypothetical protein LSAT2_029527 [Lamellibrachia satsuma]|nr:hypothetical protein LSAT2_029527 [Lamellibrachia satsuma]